MKIGVFDSGFGGLTVLKEFLHLLPEYDYLYLGDSARAPYGDKSQAEIYECSVEAIRYLFKQDCALVIVACNSASSEGLHKVQQEYLPVNYPDRRVLGVIVPIAEEVALQHLKSVGIIGTTATIESGAYDREILKLNNTVEIYSLACPRIAPMIENGLQNTEEFQQMLVDSLRSRKLEGIGALVLACTHYPLVTELIKKIIGDGVVVLDGGMIVARKLRDYLVRHSDIEKKLSKGSRVFYRTTGTLTKFVAHGETFLGQKMVEVKKISL